MGAFAGRVELLEDDRIVGAGHAQLRSTATRYGLTDWSGTIQLDESYNPRTWPDGSVKLRVVNSGVIANALITNQRISNAGATVTIVGNGDPPPF